MPCFSVHFYIVGCPCCTTSASLIAQGLCCLCEFGPQFGSYSLPCPAAPCYPLLCTNSSHYSSRKPSSNTPSDADAENHGSGLEMLACLWLLGQGLGLPPQALHVPRTVPQVCQSRSAAASGRHSQTENILLSKAQPKDGRG